MQSIYYRIWADAIISQKEKKAEGTNWKLYTLVPISVLEGINLFTIFYWMRVVFSHNLLLFMPVNIFNARPLNGFISVVITFFVPFLVLNYLLIFNNDRYKRLTEQYGSRNGALYKKYALISLGLLIIPIIIRVTFFG